MSVQGVPVEQVEETKLLWVVLESRFKWSEQKKKNCRSYGKRSGSSISTLSDCQAVL